MPSSRASERFTTPLVVGSRPSAYSPARMHFHWHISGNTLASKRTIAATPSASLCSMAKASPPAGAEKNFC